MKMAALVLAVCLAVPSAFAKESAQKATPREMQSPQVQTPRPLLPREVRVPLRLISGAETMRKDATHIVVYRGSVADNSGTALLDVERNIEADIEAIGPGGRDDTPTADDTARYGTRLRGTGAYAGKPLSGWYHVALIQDPASGDGRPQAILTRQSSSMRTEGEGYLRVEPRFTLRRILPAAHYYDAQTGFRPMICYGDTHPFCVWSRLTDTEGFAVAKAVQSDTWKEIDASEWVPPTGRILRLEAVVRSVGGVGGAYVQSQAGRPGFLRAGYVNRDGDVSVMTLEVATTSKRMIGVRTDPGVSVDLYAVGFSLLQPF